MFHRLKKEFRKEAPKKVGISSFFKQSCISTHAYFGHIFLPLYIRFLAYVLKLFTSVHKF